MPDAGDSFEVLTCSVAETEEAAARIVPRLERGGVVALVGDLGAGKTQFVRGLVRAMGGDDHQVHSPTYVILHTYPLGNARKLHHLDAYRVVSADEFEAVGFDELLAAAEEGDVIAVEWPSRISELLPPTVIHVSIAHESETTRRITVS